MKTVLSIALIINSLLLGALMSKYHITQGDLGFITIIAIAVGFVLGAGSIIGLFDSSLWKNDNEYEKQSKQ